MSKSFFIFNEVIVHFVDTIVLVELLTITV